VKRVITIVILVFGAHWWSSAQITRISGDLRYEQQYQDLQFNDQLSTSLRYNPMLDLGLNGIILAQRVCDFNIHTSFNLDYGDSHVRELTLSNQQTYWNAYDATASFFEFSPIKFQLSARDHIITAKSKYDTLSEFDTKIRSQEQRIQFGVDKISFLPTLNVYYIQDRDWSVEGEPSEGSSKQLSFAAASAIGQASSVNLSGSFSDVQERYSGFDEKNVSLIFTGTKEISATQHLNVSSEYYRYSDYGAFTGSLGYVGLLNDRLRFTSGMSGNQTVSAFTNYRNVGATEGLNLAVADNYQFGLSLNGTTGDFASISTATSNPTRTFGGGVTAQHTRTAGGFTIMNGFSVGYLQQEYSELFRIWEGGITNNISTSLGGFALSGNYDLSAQSTINTISWSSVSTNAGVNAAGVVYGNLRSQSSLHIRADNYGGASSFSRDQRSINLQQGFDGVYHYYIPFSIGFGGSYSWFSAAPVDHTYGWYASFTSSNFFLRGLYASYRYTRNFDPYFHRELVEQNGSFDYQYRALMFHLEFRHAMIPDRLRDISFIVSRPF